VALADERGFPGDVLALLAAPGEGEILIGGIAQPAGAPELRPFVRAGRGGQGQERDDGEVSHRVSFAEAGPILRGLRPSPPFDTLFEQGRNKAKAAVSNLRNPDTAGTPVVYR
jgi:hypothetical protein